MTDRVKKEEAVPVWLVRYDEKGNIFHSICPITTTSFLRRRILDLVMLKLLRSEILAASRQNQQNEYAPSEDSDQPGHPPSLIRVSAVR